MPRAVTTTQPPSMRSHTFCSTSFWNTASFSTMMTIGELHVTFISAISEMSPGMGMPPLGVELGLGLLPPQNVEDENGDGGATMRDKKAHVAFREHMQKGGGREPHVKLPRQQKEKMIYMIDLFNGLAQDDELKLLKKAAT